MRRRGALPAVPGWETRIRELEEELYVARSTVLDLLPAELGELLQAPDDLKPDPEWGSAIVTSRWLRDAAEAILERTVAGARKVVRQELNVAWLEIPRQDCPLCGDGSQSPYTPGFAIPDGLRRHLLGTHSSQQCRVMRIARALAEQQMLARKALE